jgi:hypothetical protein
LLGEGWKAVKALAKHGPTPAVVGVIAVGAFGALALKADPLSVVVVAFLVIVTYIWGQEREAKWRRDKLKAEYDAIAQGSAEDIRRRLGRRRTQNQQKEQPSLFPPDQEPPA